MLSTAWELAKRHKGKIIAGSLFVGGAIAFIQTESKKKTLENSYEHNELPNQARRHYIFDSTHRSCDQSISDLIPSLTTQIEARFDVEAIKNRLSNSDISSEEKLKLWNLLKVNVFSRIVAVAYSFSILTLTLKAQISILAADTCNQMVKRTNPNNSWRQYLPESINSMISTSKQSTASNESPMEAGKRRIFLQCIQYFTLKGLSQLMERIAEAVEIELGSWDLTESRSKQFVRELFDKIGTRIGTHGMITKLVAPLDSTTPEADFCIYELLQKLNNNLESTKSVETFNSLLDFYFSSALKMVNADEERLLKYIPSLSNSYPVISSTVFDSPLFNSLYSSDIHQFSVHVFNS